MSNHAAQARSLYRSMLRELPRRPLRDPSPIKLRIRESFSTSGAHQQQQGQLQPTTNQRLLAEGEQFVQYARAQRMYATLLDRYNPGMSMNEEERHRLTVRRVGMNMPDEWKPDEK